MIDHSGQIIFPGYASEVMIGKLTIEVLSISRWEVTAQMVNLWLLVVDLKVTDGFDAPTKIIDKINKETVQSHLVRGKNRA